MLKLLTPYTLLHYIAESACMHRLSGGVFSLFKLGWCVSTYVANDGT